MPLKIGESQLIGVYVHAQDLAHLLVVLPLEALRSQTGDDGQVLLDHLQLFIDEIAQLTRGFEISNVPHFLQLVQGLAVALHSLRQLVRVDRRDLSLPP